ncbi:MAG TPA: hypothetical protein VN843_03220 [Anaerolineales bacterium]|nr:hypothetical protein [Anaerolineales bacterium]
MRKNITCSNCHHAWEQELAERLLRIGCPQCGVVLDLIKVANAKPGLSPKDQALIRFAGGVMIGLLLLTILGTKGRRK